MTAVAPPRRRRRWIGWLIALVILVALGIAAWFIGDRIARDYAESVVRDQLLLAFPSSDPVVTIGPGSVLAQALAGSLDTIHVDLGPTDLGGVTGDVSLDAEGVPLDVTKPITTLAIDVAIGEAEAQQLISGLDGLENATLSLTGDEISLDSSFTVFTATIPLGISFTPAAADGAIELTPSAVSVNGAELSLTELASGPFGGVVSAIVKPQTVCVAEYLPVVLRLTDAAVSDGRLLLSIDGSGVVLDGDELETLGTC